jgi:hypothetical protein
MRLRGAERRNVGQAEDGFPSPRLGRIGIGGVEADRAHACACGAFEFAVCSIADIDAVGGVYVEAARGETIDRGVRLSRSGSAREYGVIDQRA